MAAEAIVSKVFEDLASTISREIEQEVRLVVGVRKEVAALTTKFRDVQAVLIDAEKRQLTDDGVKRWMSKLKNISYDMDDVIDEWTKAIGKSLIKGDDDRAPHQNNDNKKKKVRFSTCFSCLPRCREVGLCHHIAVKIEDLNEHFDAILNKKCLLKFSFHQMETTTQ